jgi:hypothetical protein
MQRSCGKVARCDFQPAGDRSGVARGKVNASNRVSQKSQVGAPALRIPLRKLTTALFSSRALRSRTISRYCFSINGAGRISEFFHREIASAFAPIRLDNLIYLHSTRLNFFYRTFFGKHLLS